MQCKNVQKRRLDLIADIVLAKVYKKLDNQTNKTPKYIIPIHFDNKGLEFVHLNSILHKNGILNCLPDSLQEDEIPSDVYGLSSTIRN